MAAFYHLRSPVNVQMLIKMYGFNFQHVAVAGNMHFQMFDIIIIFVTSSDSKAQMYLTFTIRVKYVSDLAKLRRRNACCHHTKSRLKLNFSVQPLWNNSKIITMLQRLLHDCKCLPTRTLLSPAAMKQVQMSEILKYWPWKWKWRSWRVDSKCLGEVFYLSACVKKIGVSTSRLFTNYFTMLRQTYGGADTQLASKDCEHTACIVIIYHYYSKTINFAVRFRTKIVDALREFTSTTPPVIIANHMKM